MAQHTTIPLAHDPQGAAELLGISRAKLYQLMAAGEIPSVKIGRCRRVRHEDLVAYLDRLGIEAA